MKPAALSYTPYRYINSQARVLTMLGFNGERLERHSGAYLLGNGYRLYNPMIMRFFAPDSLSPFGDGGFNAYGYCAGDPINKMDPSGHVVFNRSRRQPILLTPAGPPPQTAQHLNRALNRQRLSGDSSPDSVPLTPPPVIQQPRVNRNPLATGNRMPFQDRRNPGVALREVVNQADRLIESRHHLAFAEEHLASIHAPEMRLDYLNSLTTIRNAVSEQQVQLSRDMVRWFHS